MSNFTQRLRRAVMGVSDAEATSFSPGDTPTWQHLETAVRTAVGGYHEVLGSPKFQDLIPRLDAVPLPERGYAYEGAAMGLTGLDCFSPGPSRFRAYLEGPGHRHVYMVHIGAGEALARLKRRPERFLSRLPDPALRWLVMDGYGFHEGFFKPVRFVQGQHVPKHLSDYARRVFDQGVGRSLWFTQGADPKRITETIATFPADRQADLWLGIGVACGYVGGVDQPTIEKLRTAAGPFAIWLGVGTAFVAKGRNRAGNPTPDTDLACHVLCGGISSSRAAQLVDDAFLNLPDSAGEPAYERLQRRLATALHAEKASIRSERRRAA